MHIVHSVHIVHIVDIVHIVHIVHIVQSGLYIQMACGPSLVLQFLYWVAEMGIFANYCTTTKRTVETSDPCFSQSVPTGSIGPFSICDVYIVSLSVCVCACVCVCVYVIPCDPM